MKEREILIYLSNINGVGWKTIDKIMGHIDSLNKLPLMQPIEIAMLTDIDYHIAEKIVHEFTSTKVDHFLKLYDHWLTQEIQIITPFDNEYPENLREISQSPWVIYALGNLGLLTTQAIAIVGTRNPTSYGRVIAENIAKDLIPYDLAIVSGMARGVDSIAHKAVLSNKGKTIAVLGNGIDIVYPRENQRLYAELKKDGLIISEYPPGTKPHPGFFPQRNRIISGLSIGTIVIEASLKSGSLITAQFALEQSRDVFAVPGPITSNKSLGTNSLIKQGAKLVQNVHDIVEEFPYIIKKKENKKQLVEMNDKEREIINNIQFSPIHIDEIFRQVHFPLSEIYEALLGLQLKKQIIQLPGGFYVRATI